MKILSKLLVFAILLTFISCNSSESNETQQQDQQPQTEQEAQQQTENTITSDISQYYVFASSGLNMRKTSDPKSDVVFKVPYGSTVKVVENTERGADDMVIENLNGQMLLLQYNDQQGYMFDGFLSQFPAPKQYEELGSYYKRLKKEGYEVSQDSTYEGDEGHFIITIGVLFPTEDLQEVFLIAKHLSSGRMVLKDFTFPKASSKQEEVIENPNKSEYAWEDNMTVTRDANGNITKIKHYYRGEGGGTSSIIYAPKDGKTKLEVIGVAD